ncbi:MAG: hypothetical protein VR68_00835 [Peptococcaceae bacterium BRH_c4a]|nr:MAG: hypothetical protein VR68_00835 [Peptococcaceae bacterium BRH_c4a]
MISSDEEIRGCLSRSPGGIPAQLGGSYPAAGRMHLVTTRVLLEESDRSLLLICPRAVVATIFTRGAAVVYLIGVARAQEINWTASPVLMDLQMRRRPGASAPSRPSGVPLGPSCD